MVQVHVEHDLTLWMDDDVPTRMFYGGRRWQVSDMPTRIRDSVWVTEPATGRGFYGWRFQATDETGESFVFDVYPGAEGWHVHHCYV